MFLRLIHRFGQRKPYNRADLKNQQFQSPSIDLHKAKRFIQYHKQYMPYSQTITQINGYMLNNFQILDKQYIKALVQWRYALPDVFRVAKSIVEKQELQEHEMDFLEMMILIHVNEVQFLDRFIKELEKKAENGKVVVKDAKRVLLAERVDPIKTKLLTTTINQKLAELDNLFELCQLIVYLNTNNKQMKFDPWSVDEKQLKKDISIKVSKLLFKNLYTLSEKETGEILGNLIPSSSFKELTITFFPSYSSCKINSQEQFMRFLNFTQQLMLIMSTYPLTGHLNKIFEIMEIKKEKFKDNKNVQDAVETNRYFIQALITEPSPYKRQKHQ